YRVDDQLIRPWVTDRDTAEGVLVVRGRVLPRRLRGPPVGERSEKPRVHAAVVVAGEALLLHGAHDEPIESFREPKVSVLARPAVSRPGRRRTGRCDPAGPQERRDAAVAPPARGHRAPPLPPRGGAGR